MKPLVIYHGNCPDGFTAAWVTARALGDVQLYAGEYGKEPPYELARGRDVYVVDFSYPREAMLQLAQAACGLIVLDHHKTAQEALAGLESDVQRLTGNEPIVVFDMNRSGAGLAWDYFHPGKPRPWIVDYVEDRDLWRFKLMCSEELSLFIRAAPHELADWDGMAQMELAAAIEMAEGCKRYLDHYVRDALRQLYSVTVVYPAPSHAGADLDWHREPAVAVNVSYTGVSDVLQAALEKGGVRVAIGWHLAADGRLNCSMRSTKDCDCSVIAKALGGGGHAQASGFKLAIDHPLARELLQIERCSVRAQQLEEIRG